ncbi:MAG TPA: phospholipase D-like domain-containing protein, partial [Chloroflexota bacterium]|nr:phospholipase D-like domain-containing protein [Chloroflexota bacterium]
CPAGRTYARSMAAGRSQPGSGKRQLLRLAGRLAAAFVLLQAAVIAGLQVVSVARRKLRPQAAFPHARFAPVSVGANELQLYSYGEHLYEDMLAAIDAARERIYLETFIWKGDAVGRKFKERLVARAEAGIEVYVIHDHFGNLVVPASFKEFPPAIHVLAYRAMTRPWQVFDPRHYALEHRKLLVVDGREAFIGGYNIGAAYATKWRDTHLRIEGPGAADLAQDFASFWNEHVPEDQRITRAYRRHFDPLFRLEGNDAAKLAFPIRDMYLAAIDTAAECVRLTSAYFVPDSALVRGLIQARRRGVEVKILLPWVSNHVVTDWLARGYFEQLLREGVRIFAYEAMLHAKTCTIDGQWCTVGTANLDRLSAVGNYEVNIEVYSADLARQMEELFEGDLEKAHELHLDEWLNRPWPSKLSERILEPLRSLM